MQGKRTIVVATLLAVLLCALVIPASATDIRHAEGAVIINDGRWIGHHALVFNADYNPNWHPKVGGVGGYPNFLLIPLGALERNAQNWDWVPYGDKSAMLIPTRYVINVYNFNYANDIYIDHDSWIPSTKDYNVWQFC
ncbi:hypothetical protein KAI56_00540 [Candidatus Parcubacteria bacterium]|nr:hypothetical protein [Candidatus Parcubacteria bacterium]